MSKKTISYKAVKATTESIATSLCAILDELPENLKTKFADQRKSVTDAVAALPKTEDVEDETSVNSAVEAIGETNRVLLASLETAGKELKAATTSLNRLADLDQKIVKGDLIEKAKHDELITAARTDGEKIAKDTMKITSGRRAEISTLGIPVPGDDQLDGTDAEFKTRKELADKRAKEMKATGISLNGVFGMSIWSPEEAFQRDLKIIKESRGQRPDPMKGGSTEKAQYAGAV